MMIYSNTSENLGKYRFHFLSYAESKVFYDNKAGGDFGGQEKKSTGNTDGQRRVIEG